ncbi:DMT family transporter [Sphaerochaeta sp. PS]|uniref:DMT family transporter n=1 Tax=Sphaerochaeta sp. PS TaxID=3076336 RepID=UPI0028A523A0|nr:DMT family transporter [Sphaerochaeta sp. PS]MDT4762321.1 DMT family transporter [Sphaerochaeta sp. PS]
MDNSPVILPKTRILGHLAVLSVVVIWATTYISTKILLEAFSPMQILLIRTILGFSFLFLCNPRKMVYKQKGDRLLLAAAGLCGIFLYYYVENTALVFTSASNVGVIVATAPFFILLVVHFVLKEEQLKGQYFLGFLLSMVGISLISYSGQADLKLNPLGDLLAVLGIVVWAFYTTLTRVVSRRGYPTLLATRTMFFYALLGMVVATLIHGELPSPTLMVKPPYLYHLLFLGLIASALCFVLWNFGLKSIGAVKSSFYLYLSPVITIVFSVIVLGEVITTTSAIGTALTLGGLLVSEYKRDRKKVL